MILKKLTDAKTFKKEIIKAKIISAEGSVPRNKGAFMLVSKKITALLITGPAKGPLPTSSIPTTFLLYSFSILKSGKLFFFQPWHDFNKITGFVSNIKLIF